MKIIISPSKTQQNTRRKITGEKPLFYDSSLKIREIIEGLDKNEIAEIMKIKDKKLQEVMGIYDGEKTLDEVSAIECYTGTVFKEIKIEEYNEKDMDYCRENLRILSAMYGVLKPDDMIKPYRLDMNMKIPNISLNEQWKDRVTDYFHKDEKIVNLASKEFSKLVNKKMIDINFKVLKDGKLKTIGTYAKKARGIMVNEIIKNKTTNPEDLKKLSPMDFIFNKELSKEDAYTFVKTV